MWMFLELKVKLIHVAIKQFDNQNKTKFLYYKKGELTMKKATELIFTVNGIEQKLTAKLINEVFANEDGTTTFMWHSGRKAITDKYLGKKWVHKKIFNKEGSLESEMSRIFDDNGKLISISEDKADGGRETTLYEYDDSSILIHQKTESMSSDGSTKVYERWYKNFSNGGPIDESKLNFEKDVCYRELDENGKVIHFIDSYGENFNEYVDGALVKTISKKDGKIRSQISYYKSDDELIEVQKSENLEDKSIYYEIKDYHKTIEVSNRVYATYMITEKM